MSGHAAAQTNRSGKTSYGNPINDIVSPKDVSINQSLTSTEKTSNHDCKDDLIAAVTQAIDSRLDTRLDQFGNDLTDLRQDHRAIQDLRVEIQEKDQKIIEMLCEHSGRVSELRDENSKLDKKNAELMMENNEIEHQMQLLRIEIEIRAAEIEKTQETFEEKLNIAQSIFRNEETQKKLDLVLSKLGVREGYMQQHAHGRAKGNENEYEKKNDHDQA